MSSIGPTTTHWYPSTSSLQLIIHALDDYTKQTGVDLAKEPFAKKLELAHSPDDILELMQEHATAFKEYREGNTKLIRWLTPVVRVLHTFSGTLGEAVPLAPLPPAKAFFTGIDVLLTAACDVSSSYDTLTDLFECIGRFIERLKIYTSIPTTAAMTDIIVKILVELIYVLSLATKQIKQGRFKKFAKKLLLGESEIEDVLHRLDRLTRDEAQATASYTLELVHDLVNTIRVVMKYGQVSMGMIRQISTKMGKVRGDLWKKDVQLWLSPPDPSTTYERILEAYHRGTGQWLFRSTAFTEWKVTRRLLWVHGKPGSGKSTLLSAIIHWHELEGMYAQGITTMAYYFFDSRDNDKQDLTGLLASLISQLYEETVPCHDIISRLYSTHTCGLQTWKPTCDTLTQCLKSILKLPRKGPIYIIIDALDECPNSSGIASAREKILDLVEKLVTWDIPNVHLCVSSRPEADIKLVLEPLTPLQIFLDDEDGQHDDVINYINSVVHSDRMMRSWREEDRELVIETLSRKANGMFRWVVCQLDTLRRSFPCKISSVLESLPEGLDETYKQALLRIDKEKRESTQHLFQCLAKSFRPLRVEELAEIIATRRDPAGGFEFNASWRLLNAEVGVLSACSTLISVVKVKGSRVVQFAHSSVQEFLMSTRLATDDRLSCYHIRPESAHATLAHASLSVLLQLHDKVDKNDISRFPLALYAARHWVEHARFGNVALDIQNAIERLFDAEQPHFAKWVWLYDIDHQWLPPMSETRPTQPDAKPLYYAALCGFRGLVGLLIRTHPMDVKARGGFYTTPLHAASANGHLEVTLLLLEHGADPNSRDNEDWTPLHRASRSGHLDVVRSLLEHGADVDSFNVWHQTPLCRASINGNIDVARLLLTHGADVNSCDDQQVTPLHRASQKGHTDVVRLLLDSGAEVGPRDKGGRTPLHLATRSGHLIVAESLLSRGADPNAREEKDWTPLHTATGVGHAEVARLLLTNGANVNAQNDNRDTPWDLATTEGNGNIAKLLLEFTATPISQVNEVLPSIHIASQKGDLNAVRSLLEPGNVDVRDESQQTPLFWSSRNGQLNVSRFLLECGADVNARDNKDWTALHIASRKGHLSNVQLLLDCGADINQRTTYGETAIHHASIRGNVEVVDVLVKRGANVNARNNFDQTPLHAAVLKGHLNVVRFLLKHKPDINMKSGDGQTPLDLALDNKKLEVVECLRHHGAEAESPDTEGWSLHKASKKGRMDIVESLLGHGEDVNSRNDSGETPLDLASYAGQIGVVRLLLEQGANVDSRDDNGCTPLISAAGMGHLDVVELLLRSEADINAQDNRQSTPLFSASQDGHLGVAQLLLKQGADAHLKNNEGKIPLDAASEGGYREIGQLLLAAQSP